MFVIFDIVNISLYWVKSIGTTKTEVKVEINF
jgi:hypothetical protein